MTRQTFGRTLTTLGQERPELSSAQLLPMKPVSFRARDDLTIHGYLTEPATAQRGQACVLHVHGGPWGRDAWGFHAASQYLASRRYCVMQLNFRGSTGYGREFLKASYRQWGLPMQDDVSDAAQWLISQGLASSDKLAIYGASYGGYATLAAVAFTPDLFAAAVEVVGVSNPLQLFEQLPPHWEFMRRMFEIRIGHPIHDAQALKAVSSALHTDRIRTPLMVVQGATDPRVKKVQSDQIVQRLRQRGVAVEYMVKEDEGHGFNKEENLFDMYQAVGRFLDQHLMARP